MAHLSCIEFTPEQEVRLLEIARRSIARGLLTQRPLLVDPAECVGALGEPLGSFVTLMQRGVLRGCVGLLVGNEPLAAGVATAAFNAAFNDARFAPLTRAELEITRIEISVLSVPTAIKVGSEEELIAALMPPADGLILEDRGQQATFLPKVWEKVSNPRQFVRELKMKAGLDSSHWSDTIRCYRYHTTSITERREQSRTTA